MAEHKKTITREVTERTVITLSEDEVKEAVRQFVEMPDADVEFDVAQGGWIREATVTLTNYSSETENG